jgi:hypothetical protein
LLVLRGPEQPASLEGDPGRGLRMVRDKSAEHGMALVVPLLEPERPCELRQQDPPSAPSARPVAPYSAAARPPAVRASSRPSTERVTIASTRSNSSGPLQ